MSTGEYVLQVEGLTASYGKVPVLRGVNMGVARGQVVTLIGANGAGKSTLMKCISGLLKSSGGSIRLHGELATNQQPDALVRRGLSLVPEGRRLFGAMTVIENLMLGAYCRKNRVQIEADLEQCLEFLPDLRSRLSAQACSLSGGQQQMVAVGRALMSKPKLLLLDEPTIGLAPAVVEQIAQVIGKIRDTGVDVLLVEQNAETALRIADYAYVVEGGSIVAEGPAAELAQNEDVQRAYMGM
ncbi:ABC transporter ATP-binding protein [Pseudomonas guariconensis]|uniref:ABC transporter ATP-binding protein n=1 Tax=Pseudomonas TaxID=286 RepID=UPI002097D712|nr:MULTISPECIES: ABC transporter ATP-binding protein [Pseudomonas]MCO7641131.1 ABC transporter ATP-binding protein [Pseudomonas sp. S 311-6]MCO7515413.1 ABC transporter ATP-binding protein [Pseudomonas putida]MCO7566512.1 ABC transporter ATP-binding protein [Pseudomonas mosselii]MCO7596506.1 ABC transporter ATP-binding protein [Pseudomonas guariconensis]MCO7605428.1 ABC transporter ATP-binding protein [Pseudomonas guariconensis]